MNLETNKDISHLSNFKTKAFSKYYFEVNSRQDIWHLWEIYDFAVRQKLQILILGWGTNLLFAFDEFDGIIIKNNLRWYTYDPQKKQLTTATSESIWEIAQTLERDHHQDLWHRFIWLPGSVGWAIFWNAGCFWLETQNNFVEVEVYNFETKGIEILPKDDAKFSYRNSIFKETQTYFLIEATFDLSQKREKYASEVDNIKFREEIQPKGNSCGSFFKNPSQDASAGKLIELVGLKWYLHGDAYFSEKHANFLMTQRDGADYRDLLFLIEEAQNRIQNQFWIELVPEVRIITNKI